MNVKEYGVKSSWDGWRTFAYVSDGTKMGLMPITWANELFKTRQQAKTFINDFINDINIKAKIVLDKLSLDKSIHEKHYELIETHRKKIQNLYDNLNFELL